MTSDNRSQPSTTTFQLTDICRNGFADRQHLRNGIRGAHREILRTGGLRLGPEAEPMRRARVQPVSHWRTPREIPGVIPAWYVIGHFDDPEHRRLAVTFPPEKEIDLEGAYRGKDGMVRCVTRLSHGGVVGLGELVGPHATNVAAYAHCTITSDRQQNVQMRIGSADDAVVWLNDKEIWRYEGSRGIVRDHDIVDVVLPSGPSRILVKCCNRAGMWAFFVRFTDNKGQPLEGLKFSPAGSRL